MTSRVAVSNLMDAAGDVLPPASRGVWRIGVQLASISIDLRAGAAGVGRLV